MSRRDRMRTAVADAIADIIKDKVIFVDFVRFVRFH